MNEHKQIAFQMDLICTSESKLTRRPLIISLQELQTNLKKEKYQSCIEITCFYFCYSSRSHCSFPNSSKTKRLLCDTSALVWVNYPFVAAGVCLLAFLHQVVKRGLGQSEARTGAVCFVMNSDCSAAASSHVCRPDWDLTLSHTLPNRLCLDRNSMACPAQNLIYLKLITRLLPWGNQTAGKPSALVLCPQSSLSHVAVIAVSCRRGRSYNHCFGYKGAKGVDRCVPTLANWYLENILWGWVKEHIC